MRKVDYYICSFNFCKSTENITIEINIALFSLSLARGVLSTHESPINDMISLSSFVYYNME